MQHAGPSVPLPDPAAADGPVFFPERRQLLNASVSPILRKHYSRIALACFVFLISAVLAQYIAALALGLIAPGLLLRGWFITALSFVCMYLVGFPLFLLLLPKAPPWLPEKQKLGGAGELFICLVMCMGVLYPGNLLGQGVSRILGQLLGSSGSNPLEQVLERLDLWAVALFAVLLAPIMEELIFRKLLLDRMRTIDRPTAILFSAMAFGLFHGNLSQFFYAFGAGLLFGSIYVRTGRLRYTVILHILVNAIGSLVPMLLQGDGESLTMEELLAQGEEAMPALMENLPSMLGMSLFGLAVFCCTVAGIVLLVRRFPRLRRRTAEDRLPEPWTAFRTVFLTGGFAAFLLASVLEMVLSLLVT